MGDAFSYCHFYVGIGKNASEWRACPIGYKPNPQEIPEGVHRQSKGSRVPFS